MGRILVVDNYDSFTYNLVHLVETLTDDEVTVRRNDKVEERELGDFEYIIFSPGPGLPEESNQLLALVKEAFRLEKRVLGVCLGHQAMALVSGASLKNLTSVHHGVAHRVFSTNGSNLFKGLKADFTIGRYHSWVVNEEGLSKDWMITCRDDCDEVMGIEHRSKPFFGVQFHPESVLTTDGLTILGNFLSD